MNKLNAVGWFYALIVSIIMDSAAAGIIWAKGFDWASGIFAACAVSATLGSYKFYKEENK